MTRVLVVDDSALMRGHLREMLERDGAFEVHTARNGADALEQTRRLQPDVVTLDVNMPVIDGLTCLRHLMEEMPRGRWSCLIGSSPEARACSAM
ncbi:MAG: response regulator [Solirubrobacteraceae bacterium]